MSIPIEIYFKKKRQTYSGYEQLLIKVTIHKFIWQNHNQVHA